MEPKGLHAIPLPYETDESCKGPVTTSTLDPSTTCSKSCATSRYGKQSFLPSFFSNFRQDDIILIALIILLLMEGSECDLLLVGILVIIFLAGLDGSPGF